MTDQRSARIAPDISLVRQWTVRRLPRNGIGATLVVGLAAGGYLVARALADWVSCVSPATATALAITFTALLFLPLYLRVEQLVDRLWYGSRPTPYSVLADIAALSRATSKDAPNLVGVAEAVARGLGASSCLLTVTRPGLRERTYAWPDGATADAGDYLVVPIRLGVDQIGSLAVDRAAVTHAERRDLLKDIAESLGVVLQVSRLGIELERQLRVALAHAEDIASSRRQTVAEMDSERRMIERNLHDGAQHHLVSLRLALGLVEHEVACGQFAQAWERLGQLATQIDTTEAVLVETATGVSSLALPERGLIAALHDDLSGPDPSIVVSVPAELSTRRFPPEVEAAVYFSCLEAVNNARKHAPGTIPEVAVSEVDGTLRFMVRDQGPGFVVESAAGGSDAGDNGAGGRGAGGHGAGGHDTGGRGLHNMSARIAAVGGELSIQSIPGTGTTIEGCVPLHPDVPPAAPAPAAPPSAAPEPVVSESVAPEPVVSAVPAAGAGAEIRGAGLPADGGVRRDQPVFDQVRDVVREAAQLCQGSAQHARLVELQDRLEQPLRIGIVGLGASRQWPFAPEAVAVAIALQRSGLAPADADRPVAQWPLPELHPVGLTELLGSESADLAAAESAQALSALDGAAAAPAEGLVLLVRQPCDFGHLATFQQHHAQYRQVNAVGVLAAADEVDATGSSGLTAAHRAAAQCRADPQVRRVCREVVWLAGPPAVAGATLREAEYLSLRRLSDGSEDQVRRCTQSVDTFLAADSSSAPDEVSREALLDRFGLVGIRLAVEEIRAGRAPDPAALATALQHRSGLRQLQELLTAQFTRRSGALKARSALRTLDAVLRSSPATDGWVTRLRYQLDRIRSGAHELTEIDLVDELRSGVLPLTDQECRAAEKLLGAAGAEPWTRLGLPADAPTRELRRAAALELARWQRLAAHPASTRTMREAAEVLIRTCEDLLAQVGPAHQSGS